MIKELIAYLTGKLETLRQDHQAMSQNAQESNIAGAIDGTQDITELERIAHQLASVQQLYRDLDTISFLSLNVVSFGKCFAKLLMPILPLV